MVFQKYFFILDTKVWFIDNTEADGIPIVFQNSIAQIQFIKTDSKPIYPTLELNGLWHFPCLEGNQVQLWLGSTVTCSISGDIGIYTLQLHSNLFGDKVSISKMNIAT